MRRSHPLLRPSRHRDYVEVIDQLAEPSLQPLFAKTALLVTDYSSVAFEIAYIEKPVIYYQFDAEQFYGGGHLGFGGYFDFARDGFGPVCETEDDPVQLREGVAFRQRTSIFRGAETYDLSLSRRTMLPAYV